MSLIEIKKKELEKEIFIEINIDKMTTAEKVLIGGLIILMVLNLIV